MWITRTAAFAALPPLSHDGRQQTANGHPPLDVKLRGALLCFKVFNEYPQEARIRNDSTNNNYPVDDLGDF